MDPTAISEGAPESLRSRPQLENGAEHTTQRNATAAGWFAEALVVPTKQTSPSRKHEYQALGSSDTDPNVILTTSGVMLVVWDRARFASHFHTASAPRPCRGAFPSTISTSLYGLTC